MLFLTTAILTVGCRLNVISFFDKLGPRSLDSWNFDKWKVKFDESFGCQGLF